MYNSRIEEGLCGAGSWSATSPKFKPSPRYPPNRKFLAGRLMRRPAAYRGSILRQRAGGTEDSATSVVGMAEVCSPFRQCRKGYTHRGLRQCQLATCLYCEIFELVASP